MMKKIWILVLVLFVTHIAIQYYAFEHFELKSFSSILEFLIDYTINLILIFFLGIVVALLISLIPYKQKSFLRKVDTFLPLGFVVILILLIASFGSLAYKKFSGEEGIRTVVLFDQVEIPDSLSCSSVKNGKFEFEKFVIQRYGDNQIQTNKKTKEIKEFKVRWISDCEYEIIPIKNQGKKSRVKIVEVHEDYYLCYSAMGSFAKEYKMVVVK